MEEIQVDTVIIIPVLPGEKLSLPLVGGLHWINFIFMLASNSASFGFASLESTGLMRIHVRDLSTQRTCYS